MDFRPQIWKEPLSLRKLVPHFRTSFLRDSGSSSLNPQFFLRYGAAGEVDAEPPEDVLIDGREDDGGVGLSAVELGS